MREAKKVYQQFELLHRNKERELTKVTYSSLDKYSKSPYLQKVIQPSRRSPPREEPPKPEKNPASDRKADSLCKHQLPKLTTPSKFNEGYLIGYFKSESGTIENQLVRGKQSIGSHSATLETQTPKKEGIKNKLQPIARGYRVHFASKSRAGTNGRQAKINQDIAIAELRLPFGIKLFCVCDGHGINGHLVSAFIKVNLLKNLNSSLKKITNAPITPELTQLMTSCLSKTNQQLLDSDINTELSGSTVVAVLLFGKTILSFNVGDSRAVLAKQHPRQSTTPEQKHSLEHFSEKSPRFDWETLPLSVDQKPDRADERERIQHNGGRVFAQKNEKGEDLGPLRVWMKELLMPGLAMTRSFGDKAGLKAGTSAEPEVQQFQVEEEDKFIVIASDGIWEYLDSEEVVKMIVPFYLKDELEMACERLVRVASQIWQKVSLSRDDITIIVVSLNPPFC